MATRVLMVCLGNICRSPLAEGILRHKVDSKEIVVDSAGTARYHVGDPPDRRSIAVARKHGIDISGQRCRQVVPGDFQRFDHIYAMDQDNYEDLLDLAPTDMERSKVQLLLDGGLEVPDPYYGNSETFEEVFALIDRACEALAERLSPNPKS